MNKLTTVKKGLTDAQLSLISRTVAKGATKDELAMFMMVADKAGLDPFTKQIHYVKRKVWNKELGKSEEVGTIQVGIDGLRAIAVRSGNLAGNDDPVFDTEEGDHPNKATVTVYRMVGGEARPFTASARWSEYAAIHPKTKEVMGQWAKMPFLMLGKCAETLALRKAFPNDLSGIYTNEEMDQDQGEIVTEATVNKDKKEELAKLIEKSEQVEKNDGPKNIDLEITDEDIEPKEE